MAKFNKAFSVDAVFSSYKLNQNPTVKMCRLLSIVFLMTDFVESSYFHLFQGHASTDVLGILVVT